MNITCTCGTDNTMTVLELNTVGVMTCTGCKAVLIDLTR